MNKFFNEQVTVVITGASSGIGKSISELLIKQYGVKVVGIGRNEQKLLSLKEDFKDKFIPYKMDVSIKENWAFLDNFLTENNIKPSVIINCAGVLPKFSKFDKDLANTAENVFKINFFSIVYSAETFLERLKTTQNSMIINVLSSSALCPFKGTSIYCASKSAGERFSECLAFENKKVKIVTVMPGFTKTNVMRSQNASDEELKIIDKFSKSPEKVAKIIIKKASRGKKRIITGFDAHLMNFMFKFFPNTAPRLIGWFLKKTKMKLFEDI